MHKIDLDKIEDIPRRWLKRKPAIDVDDLDLDDLNLVHKWKPVLDFVGEYQHCKYEVRDITTWHYEPPTPVGEKVFIAELTEPTDRAQAAIILEFLERCGRRYKDEKRLKHIIPKVRALMTQRPIVQELTYEI